ncbi:MAG: urea ABC transporter permease subunit UrtB, partial [Chitinophagales bacterium]|nr:urea ABC transporter permease subunit UrtB [Hyphomicrobiales bacterium]
MLRIVLVIIALLSGGNAQAQSIDAALDRLAADAFTETEAAIGEIATSGAPNAQAILEAMAARRLVTGADKRVVYTDASGLTIDARTGKETAPATGASPVRLNNKLRGVVDSAIGLLRLFSPDRQKRLEAAESVFKAKNLNALPALDAAIAKEADAEVKSALVATRSVLLLAKPDASDAERVAAIEALAARGNQDALGQIRNALPALQGEARVAAEAAIARIERSQLFISGAQNIWYGLSLGSVLLLAAIGLAITFGVMGVINMAHGEMVMLGAYTTFMVQEVFRAYAPEYFGLSLPIAIPLAFIVAGLIGVAIERGIIRFLYGRPLETLLATWGVSLFLQQTVRTIFGPTNRDVASPSYMSGAFDLFGLQITYGRLWIIVFT